MYNSLSLRPPVVQDDDWFHFWMDIIGLTRAGYDFEKDRWIHLPFSGGLFEQEDKDPYMWTAVNYILTKEKELRYNAKDND